MCATKASVNLCLFAMLLCFCVGKDGANEMTMWPPEKVPIITTLAKEYALFDRFFAAHPGSTYPNRQFVLSGTAHGMTDTGNAVPPGGFPQKTVLRSFQDTEGLDWRMYAHSDFCTLHTRWYSVLIHHCIDACVYVPAPGIMKTPLHGQFSWLTFRETPASRLFCQWPSSTPTPRPAICLISPFWSPASARTPTPRRILPTALPIISTRPRPYGKVNGG